jgi:hypothetical protein
MVETEDIKQGTGKKAKPTKPLLFFPSHGLTFINDSAETLYTEFAKAGNFFLRDGALVKARRHPSEGVTLNLINCDQLPSQMEYVVIVMKKCRDSKGNIQEYPVNCSAKEAKALLNCTDEAMEHSLPLRLLAANPVIIEQNGKPVTLQQGYHPDEGGIYVVNDLKVPILTVAKAKELLLDLFADYVWVSPSDASRAMAQLLSPALKIGNLLGDVDFPLDVGLADQSQGGKTHRMRFTAQVYGEKAYVLTKMEEGGVGSTSEIIGAALISGKLFILIDNVRGGFSSEILESTLRGTGSVTVRIPYRPPIQVLTRRSCWQLTSNAASFTPDLANRSIVTNHKKPAKLQAGEKRKSKAGWGDEVYQHIQQNQAHYLGAVHAIIQEYILRGKPRTKENRHNFTVWVQAMDYIVQDILGLAPLMNDHETSHAALSDPNHAWLRQVILVITQKSKLPYTVRPNDLGDISEEYGITIPRLQIRTSGEDAIRARNQHIGRILAPLFKEEETVRVESYNVTVDRGINLHGNEFKQYTISNS